MGVGDIETLAQIPIIFSDVCTIGSDVCTILRLKVFEDPCGAHAPSHAHRDHPITRFPSL